ncbi:unnamed protein product [Eruca vesicaria subsp. sativa]|uniref:Uncharacterized protein n=1 Tax=Eruca vesicaria subsp. sativa TaxID=29727 RepID=A0ABC8KVB4_ERUVS|nr:unnamed protein product [Eruca vesicaria subsp. sativa]
MKSVLIFLTHRFYIHKFRPNPHLLLRVNSISDTSSSSYSSSLVSTDRKISTFCTKSKFLEISSRNLCTHVEEPSVRKAKKELKEAFEAAETNDERISLLKEMESSSLEGNEVALSALIIGIHLYREGEDPEKVLYYAHKSLRAFNVDDNKPSLLVAMAMQLIGTASYALNLLGDSVRYLNRATQILEKLVADSEVKAMLKTVKMVIDSVDNRMGEQEDDVEDSLNSLETKEKEDSKELGVANRTVADAFAVGLNFEAALPYALEALAIHRKELGNILAEVALDRRLLGVIYKGLKEHDKAIEQKQLYQKMLEMNLEVLRGEIDDANMKVALGKYEEEISNGVVKQYKKDNEIRSVVLISMSKALVKEHKFADSKKCLEFSCNILEKKEKTSPVEVVEAYSEIALQYESMNEFETAVLLLEKTLCILEKLSEHCKGSVSARIGWLLLFLGRVSEAVAYLESAAERLKESLGPRHFSVGYVYNNLGAAFIELERPQHAAQMFAAAKDIIINGPNDACQRPSQLIPKIAVEFQQLVINNWDKHGDSTEDELQKVKRFLEELRLKAVHTLR